MDNRLLALLVCPICKGPLRYDRENNELVSDAEGVAFPIRDGIPILLESEARSLDAPVEGMPLVAGTGTDALDLEPRQATSSRPDRDRRDASNDPL